MKKISIRAIAAFIGLAGSVGLAQAAMFSAKGNVIAILAGDLYVGEAEGHLDGSGTLAIHSQKNPALTCFGQFTSSKALGGAGQMNCSDGATATFSFTRLNAFRGHGVGNSTRGAMSFAYGLTPVQAEPYLKLPEGKRLAGDGPGVALVDL